MNGRGVGAVRRSTMGGAQPASVAAAAAARSVLRFSLRPLYAGLPAAGVPSSPWPPCSPARPLSAAASPSARDSSCVMHLSFALGSHLQDGCACSLLQSIELVAAGARVRAGAAGFSAGLVLPLLIPRR